MPAHTITPCLLCILDGWGMGKDAKHNAIHVAKTPVFDRLIKNFPHSLLKASGEEVGLPAGQVGNSEVGHMNIGAGRIILQDLPRINDAMKKGIEKNKILAKFIKDMQAQNSQRVHLFGLISDGGVHGHMSHVVQLVKALSKSSLKVDIHGILDGRDTPPMSAHSYMEQFLKKIEGDSSVRIATLCGRYYIMDRDRRWRRIEQAWRAIALGEGKHEDHPLTAIKKNYEENISDEFIPPIVIADYKGMQKNDGLLMSNFRADRVRQILLSLLDDEFDEFNRDSSLLLSQALGMTAYSLRLNRFIKAMLPSLAPDDTLGHVISAAGLSQIRIAETEKYAHVTYFFNGGREEPFKGEERALIASPRVATYDLEPRMAARAIANTTLTALRKQSYGLIVVNFANPDMVGHTGNLSATIQAVEHVDDCLGQIVTIAQQTNTKVIVTADHGNADLMLNEETQQPHTAHSLNLVPFILLDDTISLRPKGQLADIAPTILDIMNVSKPTAMNGHSLIIRL